MAATPAAAASTAPTPNAPHGLSLFSPTGTITSTVCVWWLLLPSYRNRINSRLPRDGAPVDSHILNPHNKHKRDKFKGLLFRRQSLPLIQISCWKKKGERGGHARHIDRATEEDWLSGMLTHTRGIEPRWRRDKSDEGADSRKGGVYGSIKASVGTAQGRPAATEPSNRILCLKKSE